MNYKDVVNRIQEIVEDHKMLVDFGYGQVSDIKTRAQGTEGETDGADYPYLFLNPTQHVRTQQQITYNFNMIVMDMAREEEAHEYQNSLNIQSDCIQYIDDIVARLYYYYKDQPEVSMDLNYTPFYERFQDNLAGATATLSITVPNGINECIAPFEPDVPVALPIIYRVEQSGMPSPFNKISSAIGPFLDVFPSIEDAEYISTSGADLDVTFIQDGTYRFTYTTTSENLIDQSTIDAAQASSPDVWTDPTGKMYLQSGWFFGEDLFLWHALDLPFSTETIGDDYTLTHTFDINLPAGRYRFQFFGQPYVDAVEYVAAYSNVQYQIELVNLNPHVPLPPQTYPPTASFTSDETTITAGSTVQFTDTSTVPVGGPAITDWQWIFVGGTPSTSILQNPTVQYDTAGSYDVNLIVTNADAQDGETIFDYLTVSEAPANLVLDVESTVTYLIRPDLEQSPFPFQNTIIDTYTGMRPTIANFYSIKATGTWTFTITGTGTRLTDTGTFPNGLNIFGSNLGIALDAEADITNWPTDPVINVPFDFSLTYSDIALTGLASPGNVSWRCSNEPAVEDSITVAIGATLTAIYTP